MKKKIVLSLASAVLMLGLYAGTVFAGPTVTPQVTAPDLAGGINDADPGTAGVQELNSTVQTTDGAWDKGVDPNANATGTGVGTNDGTTRNSVIKSEGMYGGTQRTHGEYQNNTNSCASCHQTHTAAAKALLFKDGVYSTCTACHDGTLGFYNVFANGTMASTAGTFGGTNAGNQSVHLATGAVQIKAAPGGNKSGTGSWTGEFNCASCHAPHGSYSDRLLHYSPNGMANTAPESGGIKADKVAVFNFADGIYDAAAKQLTMASATTRFIAVRGTKANHNVTDDAITATDDVIMIYERVGATGTKYQKTITPWMYGYTARGSSTTGTDHSYYTRFFTVDPTSLVIDSSNRTLTADAAKVIDYYDEDNGVVIEFGKGLAYSNATNGLLKDALYAEIGRAYVVKMDMYKIGNYGGLPITAVNETAFSAGTTMVGADTTYNGVKQSGLGIAMSAYCAACHTDYMAKSSKTATSGTFQQAYRHSTNSDSYTCVRCHYAHGTDVEVMKDAHEDTVATLQTEVNPSTGLNWTDADAKSYMKDQNPSSALKRYTNMAVCWACHTSSHAEQLKNNEAFQSSTTAPHGLQDNVTLPTPPVTITEYSVNP